MRKNSNTKSMTPKQVLEHHADQLAAQYHQRLRKMTHEAVYGKSTKNRGYQNIFTSLTKNPWPIFLPVASLSVVIFIWQFLHQPDVTLTNKSLTLKEKVPDWVRDTEVPVAIIENIEFYQWLEKELENENNS